MILMFLIIPPKYKLLAPDLIITRFTYIYLWNNYKQNTIMFMFSTAEKSPGKISIYQFYSILYINLSRFLMKYLKSIFPTEIPLHGHYIPN